MDFSELVLWRKSKRWYTRQTIQPETIKTILSEASQAPSFMNHQPWEVAVVQGKTLQAIMDLMEKQQNKADIVKPFAWPEKWPDQQKTNIENTRKKTGQRILPDNDPLGKWNYNAPVLIYLHIHRDLNEWSILDIGAFAQTLMLAAANQGISSVPQAKVANHGPQIRSLLKLPENRKIILGITLGFADEEHANNKNKSARQPLENWTSWYE